MVRDMVRHLAKSTVELIDVDVAKAAWFEFRQANGMTTARPLLTAEDENLKFVKSGKKFSFVTFGLSLAPAKQSGTFNVCRYATGCAAICVAHNGNGRYTKIIHARTVKTQFLGANPSAFVTLLTHEIGKAVEKHGEIAVRLNTFSDLPWEDIAPWLFTTWGDKVNFYDYTKWPADKRPEKPGYDITRSATEHTLNVEIAEMLEAGERVAVVLDVAKKDPAPSHWLGFPVVDGDKHDARFTEDKGVVVLLRPKGSARKGGFVRPVAVL